MRSQNICVALLLTMAITAACIVKQNAWSQSASKNVANAEGVERKIPPEICNVLSAEWGAFETPQGVQKQMCGELPCGYLGPFKLECRDGVVTGSALLSVDSRSGKIHRAPIDVSWEDENLVLKYTNNQECLTVYRASVVGVNLIGEYSKLSCGHKNTQGDFFAKKFPLRWLKPSPAR